MNVKPVIVTWLTPTVSPATIESTLVLAAAVLAQPDGLDRSGVKPRRVTRVETVAAA